jgi:prepilin-type processing-associated H-X9-DG protein
VSSDGTAAAGALAPRMAGEPPRHRGGNNFAFVDGHVQWLRFPGGRGPMGGMSEARAVVPDMRGHAVY